MAQPQTRRAVIRYDFIGRELHYGGNDYPLIKFPDSSDMHLFVKVHQCYPEKLRANPHLLHCVALNEGSNTMFLEIFDRSLSKFMEILRLQGVNPLMIKRIPLDKKTQEENEKKPADHTKLTKRKVWYVPKVYREIMRSMVQFLVSIHEEGYCTKGSFDLPNIVMKDDAIKFFGLRFENPAAAGKDFEECVKNDFATLHGIVSRIYSGFENELPPDFKNWLDNLRNHKREEVNCKLVNHLATLSSHDRLGFLREVFEKREEISDLFNDASKTILNPDRQWKTRIKKDHGPLHTCLNIDTNATKKEDEKKSGVDKKKRKKNKKKNAVDKSENEENKKNYAVDKSALFELMGFCRNYVVHCNENGNEFCPPRLFTDDFIDASLFYVFGDELSKFGAHRLTSNSNQPKDLSKFLPFDDPRLPSSFCPLIIRMDPSNPKDLTGQHSAFTNYTLNPEKTQHDNTSYDAGVFSDSKIHFIIDSQRYFDDHIPVWPNTNPHMLHCFLVDIDSRRMFLETLGKPLLTWVEDLEKRLGTKPLMTIQLPIQKDSEDSQRKTIWYVPEKHRELMKSMVRFLVSIHEMGYCTRGFGLSNIVIKNDIVKFFGLKYVKPKTKEDLDEYAKRDFGILHKIVKQIFDVYDEDHYPPDFKIWLNELRSYDRHFQDMMVDHLATSSPSLRLRFVRDLSEEHGKTGESLEYTVRHIPDFARDWNKNITTQDGPLKVCLDKKPNLYHVGPEEEPFAFFVFCKNYIAHWKDYEAEIDSDDMGLTEEVVDASLFNLFGEQLCQIQKEDRRLSGRMNLPHGKRIREEMQDEEKYASKGN